MSSFTFKVSDRKDRDLCTLKHISDSTNLGELMKLIIKESDHLRKKNFDINRMRLTVGTAKGRAVTDKRGVLKTLFKAEAGKDEIKLVFKDLGQQISWTTVFLVEYFGPILMTVLLAVFQKQIYGKSREFNLSQKLGMAMCIGHYIKREFETLFVHRFSNETMPIFNIFKNSAHYWFLMGFCSNYFLIHPDYTAPSWVTPQMHYIFFGMFCFFEFMNLMCHITLRNLRKPGSSERGIPSGWGFGMVSCANYFWESLCWLTFSVSTQVWGAYLFWFVSTAQMFQWAVAKHRRYKQDFGDKYPRGRKVMFPFLM